ncbi:MAG: hypothetical protein JWN73_4541 [Betaproteobacteria bacterium]|nr:hypothetical protein [Betaproteobacteria bacterium]
MNPRAKVTLEGLVVPFKPDGVRFNFDILCGETRYLCIAAQPAVQDAVVREGERVRVSGQWSLALAGVFEAASVEVLEAQA